MMEKEIKNTFVYNKNTGIISRRGLVAGGKNTHGYWQIGFKNKTYLAHRLAWILHYGDWPSGNIDHINGNKLDNRIVNLRVATQAENLKNRALAKKNTSGCHGVEWHKVAKKWTARITHNGTREYLGIFSKKEFAINARKEAEKIYGFHPNHGRTI
jgi:hypothetical protein